ncbi:hypothetical protein QR685DRAFT_448655, partial [Neurospora intermedia]
RNAPAANRTRGPSMATMDFTTKPLAPLVIDEELEQIQCLYASRSLDAFPWVLHVAQQSNQHHRGRDLPSR